MSSPLNFLPALVVLVLLTLCGNTWGQDVTMPTSVHLPRANWTKMTPGSFKPSPNIMYKQCAAQAALQSDDRLTPEHCSELRAKFEAGNYEVVIVRDGIVHDTMGAMTGGKSTVVTRVQKRLGSDDRALRFRLAGDIDAYWYTGEKGRSCNNLATTWLPNQKLVAAQCGANAMHYQTGTSQFLSESPIAFCLSGRLVSKPAFPIAGKDSRWTCEGDGGSAQQCVATLAPEPVTVTVVPETEEKCELIPVRLGVSNIPRNTTVTPGRLNDTCIGTQWISGIQISSGGGTGQTFGFQKVCRTVVKTKDDQPAN